MVGARLRACYSYAMPTAVFVSDIHIVSPECPRGRLFTQFLRSLSGKSGLTDLYLLGDIFDLWVADHRYFVDRYRTIIDELRRLKNEGVAISYFEGNHDLHLRSFWADQLGLTVYEGPAYVEHGDHTLRIEHGDQSLILESFVRFRRELSILAVRSTRGETVFYPLSENRHKNGILVTSFAPANAGPLVERAAQRAAPA